MLKVSKLNEVLIFFRANLGKKNSYSIEMTKHNQLIYKFYQCS